MRWIHSIRFRLTAATGLLAASLFCVTVLGTVQFSKISTTVEKTSAETELLIRLGHTLDNGEPLVKALAKGWAEPPDEPSQVRFLATMSDSQEHLRVALGHTTPGAAHDALAEQAEQLEAVRAQLAAAKGKPLEEIEALKVEEDLTDALGALAKLKLATGQAVEANLVGVRRGVREPVRLFWIAAALGLVVALLVFGVVHLRIASPIDRLVEGVRALGRGEHVVVRAGGKDEIGELAAAFNKMAETITDRTARLRLVLDNTGDALIPLALDGTLAGACSKKTVEWFGDIREGVPAWKHLARLDPAFADAFGCAYEQLASNVFPFEVAADCMPKDLRIGKTIYGLTYSAVGDPDAPSGVLVVVSDVTAQREAEAQEAESKEVFSVVGLCFRDPQLYEGFVSDALARIAAMTGGSLARQQADLHTLKGNAGMIGFVRLAQACHALETEIEETRAALPPARFEALAQMFAESRQRVEALAGPRQDHMQVPPEELRWLHGALASAEPAVARRVASWPLARVERILDQLGGHSKRIGERLGKPVEVQVDCPDIRLERRRFEGVWSSLVHAVRNAVDHGIEPRAEREKAGKAANGRVRLAGRAEPGVLRLTIEDDGRGIDVEALRRKVVAAHGAQASTWPLVDLVCARGVSTAAQVTENSGRGIGVTALREIIEGHGGRLQIESAAGRGTRLDIELPLADAAHWHDRAAA
jgi:HPt (histidine-containing phosphotransfer) domain-containing protein/HAMP domain-containing protein